MEKDVHALAKDAGERIEQEMARCLSQYDQARADLASHHERMTGRVASLMAEIGPLRDDIQAWLDADKPLTRPVARKMLRYHELLAKLDGARRACRLSYGATVPPGRQPLGKAIGDKPLARLDALETGRPFFAP